MPCDIADPGQAEGSSRPDGRSWDGLRVETGNLSFLPPQRLDRSRTATLLLKGARPFPVYRIDIFDALKSRRPRDHCTSAQYCLPLPHRDCGRYQARERHGE
ncbi:hypothetical protein BDV32DRAFT_115947 [Aspergillus pseudonomiae]|nr:hypothetical protein BDV32DRAFT_115947 [Aspergillus pseudonomiae]